ncbi:MAG: ribonuclease H-like domain-containing protein [Syntrophobacteraceae bacterium]|nr:ribonuclease H-like domain-containing protein [Syntrophobacteraceae bacterium]
MLRNTFCHVPGIGLITERRLWNLGIHCWEQLLSHPPSVIGRHAVSSREVLHRSMVSLKKGDIRFFAHHLPSCEMWRLFAEFRDSTAYLDIETTGMGPPHDHITTIALYDGNALFHYVHGRNLEDFREDIRRYRLIVTYNGKCFDIPFLRSSLGIPMNHVHLDLRYLLKNLGYGGGLKNCEKQLGLDRGRLEGVDGSFAVLLWDEYVRKRDRKALETLLAYNLMDAANLEILMVKAYNLKMENTPFATDGMLPLPSPPVLPFEPDEDTISRLRERMGNPWTCF